MPGCSNTDWPARGTTLDDATIVHACSTRGAQQDSGHQKKKKKKDSRRSRAVGVSTALPPPPPPPHQILMKQCSIQKYKHHLPVSVAWSSSVRAVSARSSCSVSSLGVAAALISSSVGGATSSVGIVDMPSSVAGGMVVVSSADWAASSSSLMVSSTRCRLVLRMDLSSPTTSSLGDVSFDNCKDSCCCYKTW